MGIPDGIISYKREGLLIQSIFAACLNKTFVRNSSIALLSVILGVFKYYFSNFTVTPCILIHQVLFSPTHALFHTPMYQSFKLY